MDPTDPPAVDASSPKAQSSDEPSLDDFVAKDKYQKLKTRFQALR
jgi:hypothetical protein